MQTKQPATRHFWSTKEAAEYIGVTVATLNAYVRNGKGGYRDTAKLYGPPPPFRRFGRNAIRFPIEKFKQWADPPTGAQNV